MTDESQPAYVETLNYLMNKSAAEWDTTDRYALVAALCSQRERWNEEQRAGTCKRVTSKKNPVIRKGFRARSLEGLTL